MKLRLFLILFILPFALISQISNEKIEPSIYEGKIGAFDIYVELNNINDQVIGWYNYPGKSTKLRLEGSINSTGEIELKEFNYRAKHTGHFQGIIDENNTISGEWSNPEKTKHLPFAIELINRVSLIQVNSENGYSTEVIDSQEIIDEENRKMFQDSKVKGFSKLALWVTIGLIIFLFSTILFLLKNKKKALSKQKEMFEHTKEEHYKVEHIAPINSANKTNARIGYEFEKFVVDLFPKNFYKIKFWSSDKISNHNTSAESNQYPDLLIEYTNNGNKYPFAVECKYRTSLPNEAFEFTERQLMNYRQFQNENNTKVFIAIGIAGSPNAPRDFYVIPLDEVKENTVELNKLKLWYKKYDKSQLFFNYKVDTLTIWNKEITN